MDATLGQEDENRGKQGQAMVCRVCEVCTLTSVCLVDFFRLSKGGLHQKALSGVDHETCKSKRASWNAQATTSGPGEADRWCQMLSSGRLGKADGAVGVAGVCQNGQFPGVSPASGHS